MSVTNEDHNAEWELGDAITIRLEPEEPEELVEPEGPQVDDAAAGDDGAAGSDAAADV